MSRKPRAQRTPEEKSQIVLEGLKSGNIAETCRKHEIAPNLYYRWKDEVEAGAKAALGGRSAAVRPDAEQEKRPLGKRTVPAPHRRPGAFWAC
jgi:transposase-like protein